MRRIICCFGLLFLFSCADKQEIEIISKYPNGRTKTDRVYSNGFKDSSNYIQRQYYENGAIELVGQFINGKADGLFEWKYRNGKPKWVEKYHLGTPIDTTYCYYETGELKRKVYPSVSVNRRAIEYYKTGEFKIETFIKNSTYIDSTWVAYFKDGKIKEKGRVRAGLKIGYWKFYNDSTGQLDSVDQTNKSKVVFDFEEEELKEKKEK